MDHLVIQNHTQPIGFVGRIHLDQPRPALLAVSGSFPQQGHLHDLITHFAGANVLIANLPGMSGVFWANNPSVADLTRVLEQGVQRLLGDAPIVAFAASTGNLLSLGLRLPNICRRVALEPFFQTEDLWPFIADARERMKMNPGADYLQQFYWEFFGISPTELENRDYRALMQNISVPTDVITGQLPLLPRRALDRWPSFTSAADRAALAANPLVTLQEGPAGTGHGYGTVPPGDAEVKALLHKALVEAVKLLPASEP
jgi:hypothetical protein